MPSYRKANQLNGFYIITFSAFNELRILISRNSLEKNKVKEIKQNWKGSKNFDICFYVIFNCIKCVRIRSYSDPYFPAFGLNMERYSVSSRIQSKFGKTKTRVTPNTNTFHAMFGCCDQKFFLWKRVSREPLWGFF